jgi:hypothetical protein
VGRRLGSSAAAASGRFDADGSLHVTTADRDAETSDPAPERCEEDTSVACP